MGWLVGMLQPLTAVAQVALGIWLVVRKQPLREGSARRLVCIATLLLVAVAFF